MFSPAGITEGSTLRRTLGVLLGVELRRVGSGKRFTFGGNGEDRLSEWMADHAQVCWLGHDEPWILERQLISALDLPLNLQHNQHNPFYPQPDKRLIRLTTQDTVLVMRRIFRAERSGTPRAAAALSNGRTRPAGSSELPRGERNATTAA
ncbi:GIY-YIG nuclease family protein [Streptomyces sp. NPDC048514]|uniref:GIY-YIG nuclease family protein n=1 Tax=Streptomyces sp. NPDC048514 TaxID=3365564 RepID=UPI003714F7C1